MNAVMDTTLAITNLKSASICLLDFGANARQGMALLKPTVNPYALKDVSGDLALSLTIVSAILDMLVRTAVFNAR